MRPARVLLVAALLVFGAASVANALRPLTVGFSADPVLTQDSAATRAVWIRRAVDERAGIVRVNVIWSEVAPLARSAGFAPADPSSAGYDWASTDAAVRALSSRGLKVLLNITTAPRWAEGPRMPSTARPGTWRPNATQFASFARAAAVRYDGRFPDPLRPGAFLPRVSYWQAWNEPNLAFYLSPQWTKISSGWAPAAPDIYRQLLNAFYAAVKHVSPSNFVVAAGTAPYGDPPGGQRIPPVEFNRDLFCLRDDARLTPVACPDAPHLDAVSHHPYGIGGPTWHAINPNDAAVPDVYKIARVLRAAQRSGHVLPRGPKRLWVTEISWDSSPPDPAGVPIAEQARWLEQAMYVLWRQGADTVLWLQIADSPPVPSYGATYQAGLYYQNGAAKPAAVAFRFPFVSARLNRGHVEIWGRAPQTGRLAIEARRGQRWVILKKLRVRAEQVFQRSLALRGNALLRAHIGTQTSLTWRQA